MQNANSPAEPLGAGSSAAGRAAAMTTGAVPLSSSVGSLRNPEAWIAILRIGVGLWFLKGVVTKLTVGLAAGLIPLPMASERWASFLPERLAELAAGNPIPVYRDFLLEVASSHGTLFANLTAFGEAAVGLGLVLGLLTPVAAVLGLFLMMSYLLAMFWLGPSGQGFHLLLILCMVLFLATGAGRKWGLDGRIAVWRRSGQRST